MSISSRARAASSILFVCLTFMAMRVSGAHLHIHFDRALNQSVGPLSLGTFNHAHFGHRSLPAYFDVGGLLEHHAESAHDDDIEYESISVRAPRLLAPGALLNVLSFSVSMLSPGSPQLAEAADEDPLITRMLRGHLRPPLRGPPRLLNV